jgi:hypothetical protein
MFIPNEPFPLWTIWRSISFLERLFFLALLLVSIYCLFSAAKTILRLRSTRGLNPDQDRASIQLSFVGLRKRLANVRQTIGAAFYLFGFVLFTNLATIGNTVASSKTPTGYYILQNFLLQCAVAANAFFVFLVLHLIQWFVTRQVNSCSEGLRVS